MLCASQFGGGADIDESLPGWQEMEWQMQVSSFPNSLEHISLNFEIINCLKRFFVGDTPKIVESYFEVCLKFFSLNSQLEQRKET